ncbi:hypothetical protein HYG87_03850 [Methanobacterium alkalithermotolerans]|uniref:Uncharacterized protein n=1 Tax=Methanobacterium alkalithermotolerans TaxID=2731220 RepID=A0A8T8K643_9EURY|nr:hypothetical protein [Methanobacterium alkalithermotolerans]QUH22965.1 hypothetical protein HYG87_03850 [Methanobacterium alkalithermotolerans]RJS48220.1 MAG: hypothetical protein CIT03_09375 [Methanobacterium sp.]
MEIDLEQCRENDKIKEIISKSQLPIKYIKLLLRLSDGIYLNAINYNVAINNKTIIITLISSKPDNENGFFNTTSLTNIFYKLREMERENHEIQTSCQIDKDLINLVIEIKNS